MIEIVNAGVESDSLHKNKNVIAISLDNAYNVTIIMTNNRYVIGDLCLKIEKQFL
jgi:hypothetical protein